MCQKISMKVKMTPNYSGADNCNNRSFLETSTKIGTHTHWGSLV